MLFFKWVSLSSFLLTKFKEKLGYLESLSRQVIKKGDSKTQEAS